MLHQLSRESPCKKPEQVLVAQRKFHFQHPKEKESDRSQEKITNKITLCFFFFFSLFSPPMQIAQVRSVSFHQVTIMRIHIKCINAFTELTWVFLGQKQKKSRNNEHLGISIKIDQDLYLIIVDQPGDRIRCHRRYVNKMLGFRLNTLPPLSAIILTQCITENL